MKNKYHHFYIVNWIAWFGTDFVPKQNTTTYVPIAIIVIWPDPVLTNWFHSRTSWGGCRGQSEVTIELIQDLGMGSVR